MNEILVRNENNSFFIRFYNFERSVSVGYLQFRLELISPVFKVSTVFNVSIEELLLFKKDLDLMLRKCHKEVSFTPLGEFFCLRFQMKEKGIIHLNGCISDTQMPQSSLTFHNIICVDYLSVILMQIENVMDNWE